ncbi:MAG: TonB family protein [Vicinamibacterales bacterium]
MSSLLTIPNLVAWSVQVAILVGVALLTMRLLRLEAPTVRYVFLRGLLAACLLLPFVQPPLLGTGRPNGRVESSAVVAQVDGALPDPGHDRGIFGLTEVPWAPTLMVLLLAGTLARLIWIATGIARLRRLRRAGEIAPATGEHDELQSIIQARATIRYVSRLGQPVTFGFRHPIVLLPESLQEKPAAIRRAVLAHELWHVRRRDWIWTVAEEALRATFWFHPAIWMLLTRIQSTREEVVDELTILATGSRRSYVDALLAFADQSPLFAATAFARRRHLVHRMVLISKEAVMSARRVVACCAVFTAVVVSASWYAVQAFPLTQQPSASDLMSGEPGPVEQRAKAITPENPVPRRTFYVAPEYPHAAAIEGARGWVTVRLAIDESGGVAETRVTGISLKLNNRASITLDHVSSASLDRAMRAKIRGAQGENLMPSLQTAMEAIVSEAARSVRGWRYAPPVDGPLAFSVNVMFGPPADASAPPPPPPPPPPGTSGWNISDGALRVGGNISAPMKIRNVNPEYPPDAQAAKVQGVVIIEARVEADGTVGDARILRSIPMLDQAAVDAVRQWEFRPTLLNGQPVPVIMTVTVNFTLQ